MNHPFLACSSIPAKAAPVRNRAAAGAGKNAPIRFDFVGMPQMQLLDNADARFPVAAAALGARQGYNHATH
jgi:hypothetical protein